MWAKGDIEALVVVDGLSGELGKTFGAEWLRDIHATGIASEEAKAFGTNPAPAPLSSSANHALTSRGSMILYRIADPFSPPPSFPSAANSGTNIPTSHYSLKGLVATEDGVMPASPCSLPRATAPSPSPRSTPT